MSQNNIKIEATYPTDRAPVSVVLDCDNMMGALCREVDDGLALCALLGSGHVDLLGVTTTFGNGRIDQVLRHTRKLVSTLSCQPIDVKKGAAGPGVDATEAAPF